MTLKAQLEERLRGLETAGLSRHLRELDSPQGTRIQLGGRELINFSSNDYLGLANHPALKEAAIKAVADFGAGAGASRLICGSLKPFHDLEETLAEFKRAEACLSFSSGYAAAMGTITSLMGRDDIVIIDKLVHASIVDASRHCDAKLRVFKHNDLDDLERILKWADAQKRRSKSEAQNILIITESVFSMDGDLAPLREIVDLKERHGAWLMVDEAHATGLFGERRSGLIEQLGLSDRIEIQMGTLGKAVGAAGGFICGARSLIDFLVNSARSFIFSTAPVPASAAAAKAGVELIRSTGGAERYHKVWDRTRQGRTGILPVFECAGSILLPENRQDACPTLSPIIPIIIGDENQAVAMADSLRELGYFIPAIRYPTVARGTARLRMTVTADHAEADLESLTKALVSIRNSQSTLSNG
ncbi:aminotransferase class I/II-fold pyridoxal phosphate-dependent enzyme [bacterium]|nr:aminotransferase class I/II-fold pyridoxal phosphate-dependent enzyme [bacterium]